MYIQDVWEEFNVEKWAMLITKSRNIETTEVFVILLSIVLSVLFLMAVISLPLCFSM